MALLDEMIQAVGRSAKLSPEQAENAVWSALRFLAARLPSPLFGELQSRLSGPKVQATEDGRGSCDTKRTGSG